MHVSSLRHAGARLNWKRLFVAGSALMLVVASLSAPAATAAAPKPKPAATATAKKLDAQQAQGQILARKPPNLPKATGSVGHKPVSKALKRVIQTRKAPAALAAAQRLTSEHRLPAYLANVPKAAQRWSTMHPLTVTSPPAKSVRTPGARTAAKAPLGQMRPALLQPTAVYQGGAVLQTAVFTAQQTAAATPTTGSITGSITDATTLSPIEGACAIASDYQVSASYSACSDATGSYTITDVPAGSYDMTFEDHVHSHLVGWFNGQSTVIAGSATTGVNSALTQGGSVAGTISASGSPLVGACASITDMSGNYVNAGGCTDSSGRFQTVGVTPGNYKIVFNDQAAGAYMQEWYNDVATSAAASTIAVTLNTITPNINATLARGGSISGTVVAASSHSPLLNICADLYGVSPNRGYVGTRCTGADGVYTSPGLPSGTYTVSFRDVGGTGYLGQWLGNSADQASATPVNVSLGSDTPGADAVLVLGGSITGVVTDASTAATVNGACVLTNSHATGTTKGYACSDVSGRYIVNGLPTGSFDLYFDGQRAGYLGRWYKDQTDSTQSTQVLVTVSAVTSNIDQALPLGGSITGTATDAVTHAAIATVCPQAVLNTKVYYATSCGNATGSYTITGLPTGSYRVQFVDPSAIYLEQWWNNKPDPQNANPVAVTAGSSTTNIDAAMQRGGTITGNVTDAVTHAPVSDLCVYALALPFGSTQTVGGNGCTDATGHYAINGLLSGNYQAQFFPTGANNYVEQWWENSSDQITASAITVAQGATSTGINAAMQPGGTITGTITDAVTHVGVAGMCPEAVLTTTGARYSTQCSDAAGSYAIIGLRAGNYQVHFTDYGRKYVEQWWENKPDAQTANPVVVTAGAFKANIDAAMAPAGTVSGTITAGPGADLTKVCATAHKASDIYSSVGQGCADATGHYTIEGLTTGQYLIDFIDYSRTHIGQWYNNKPDSQSADLIRVNDGSDTPNINAVLSEGGWVTGTVTDAVTHRPLSNVCVSIFNPATFSYVGYSACTDAAGVYHSVALPAGDYQVVFGGVGHAEKWWNDKPSQATADLAHVSVGQATSAIDAALQSGTAFISGSITDVNTGLPISGVCVTLIDTATNFGVGQSGCSDSNGAYQTTTVPDGSYKVQFWAPYGSNYINQMYNDKPDMATGDVVSLLAGTPVTGIDAALQTGGTISGTVTDSVSGAPVAGVYVFATPRFSHAGAVSGVRSDASGHYQTNGNPAGQFTVQFGYSGDGPYLVQYYRGQVSEADANPVAVTLGADSPNIDAVIVKGATFSGTITDASTGTPISNVCVTPQPTGSLVNAGVSCSDSHGHYTTQAVAAGTYQLNFANPGGRYVEQWWNNKPDQSSAGSLPASLGVDTPNIDVAMQLGGTITGTVTAAGGLPLANICVTLYHPSDGSFAGNGGCTDSLGHYASAAVVAGSYKVGFTDSSLKFADQYYNNRPDLPSADPVSVAAGATITGIDATFAAAASSISGVVTDSGTAQPLSGVCVYLYVSGGGYAGSGGCTAADGTYSLTGLAAGSYQVAFFDPSGTHTTQWSNGATSQAAGQTLTLPGDLTGVNAALTPITTIAGTITDANTHALLGGVCAYLYQYGTETSVAASCSGADGQIAMQDIPAGTYQLAYADGTGTHSTQWYAGAVSQATSQTITVTAGSIKTDANAAMAPITSVIGHITDASNGQPLSNVCAYLYLTGSPNAAAASCSGADGRIAMQSIPAGTFQLAFADTAGLHATQWFGGTADRASSTPISLGDGSVISDANVAMAPITTLAGHVTDATSAQPLANVCAYLYPLGSNNAAAASCTVADGRIVMQGISAGDYQLAYADTTGAHATQWFGGSFSRPGAATLTLVSGQLKLDADRAMSLTGAISGTVTDASGPMANVCVYADDTAGNYSGVGACTNSAGDYSLIGLAPGGYKLGFYPQGQAAPTTHWYSGKTTEAAADTVVVVAGKTTGTINELISP